MIQEMPRVHWKKWNFHLERRGSTSLESSMDPLAMETAAVCCWSASSDSSCYSTGHEEMESHIRVSLLQEMEPEGSQDVSRPLASAQVEFSMEYCERVTPWIASSHDWRNKGNQELYV